MCGGSCEVDEANQQVKVQTFRIAGCWTMSLKRLSTTGGGAAAHWTKRSEAILSN